VASRGLGPILALGGFAGAAYLLFSSRRAVADGGDTGGAAGAPSCGQVGHAPDPAGGCCGWAAPYEGVCWPLYRGSGGIRVPSGTCGAYDDRKIHAIDFGEAVLVGSIFGDITLTPCGRTGGGFNDQTRYRNVQMLVQERGGSWNVVWVEPALPWTSIVHPVTRTLGRPIRGIGFKAEFFNDRAWPSSNESIDGFGGFDGQVIG
jgi:hypothetical protein